MKKIRNVLGVALVISLATVAEAQDPLTTLPDSYRVQFENAQVKAVRVYYPAGSVLPAHTHPAGATLYVYLNDSEGVIFRHSGEMSHVTRRPPVKSGGLRINFGHEETHTAENTAATPADMLRIQLKTATNARRGGKIPPKPFSGDNATLAEFTSASFVIQRIFIAPSKSVALEPVGAPSPSLLIEVPSGDTRWVDGSAPETIANTGATPMQLVRLIVR